MPDTPHVYLVPGFFGFGALGDLRYFHHVKELLDTTFGSLGRDVQVHRIDTLPTAAIARRAQKLLEVVRETSSPQGDIHLIGHSTGALDARSLLDPERTPTDDADRRVIERIKTVVSVAGAHRGTPLAKAFKTAFGKELLKLLALMTLRTLKLGPLPVAVVTSLATVLAAWDSAVGAKPDLLDQVQGKLLADLTMERRLALQQLFKDVADDQNLIDELTPELARHFDAQTHDRRGVRYFCVVTEARRPSAAGVLEHGLSPYAQASHAVYHALYRLTARSDDGHVVQSAIDDADLVKAGLGAMPDAQSNDGIVPTLSQFHGKLIRAVRADHHDVLGHFDDPHHEPPHVDWLLTGTGFQRAQFEALWRDVAAAILA